MKIKKLIREYYHALALHEDSLARKLYRKITKKSVKGKNTHPIQ